MELKNFIYLLKTKFLGITFSKPARSLYSPEKKINHFLSTLGNFLNVDRFFLMWFNFLMW